MHTAYYGKCYLDLIGRALSKEVYVDGMHIKEDIIKNVKEDSEYKVLVYIGGLLDAVD